LKPDIAIGLADIVYGREPGVKRRAKMVDRTHAFTQDALERLYGRSVPDGQKSTDTAYFAPVLPLDNAQQSIYLDDLQDELKSHVSGLALYESASLAQIPESLGALPRLLLSQPGGPHDLLRDVSLGGDLLTLPFVGECSDAGIALDFTFPAASNANESASQPKALGIDLWSADMAKDVSALSEGCQCYACRKHHRAYFNHLLNAKEMAAWALLQMHNYHVMDVFFAGVRESIQRGTFEEDVLSFSRVYVSELPQRTGEGPRYVDFPFDNIVFLVRFTDSEINRLRGYQLQAGPHKRGPRVYGRLDDVSQKFAESQSSVATPDTDASGLEHHGFAAKV
jgi:queuine tRNA-ribosyltransferase